MNVLFIVKEYYPYPSAITNCLNPIINELKKDNKVFILTKKSANSLPNFELVDDVFVNRIVDNYQLYLNKRNNSKGIKRFFYKLLFHIIYKKNDNPIVDEYINNKVMIKIGKKLIKDNNIDIIISCSFPFTCHMIANKIKINNIKWIAYQFDPYTYNYTLSEKYQNNRLKNEINVLKNANKIFITEENYNENMKTKLNVLKDKYIVLQYPLIQKSNLKMSSSNDEISLIYAGTLYNGIRNPFPMLDILSNLEIDFKLNLYYFTDLDTENLLLEYKKKIPNLNLYSNIKKEVCDFELAKSNILLNIGNSMLNQTPSKVYELISTGKPIINFYDNLLDTSKNILINYPLCYNINVNNFKDYDSLKDFILKNKNTILSFDEATKNYLKKEEVTDIFIKEVRKIYEDR